MSEGITYDEQMGRFTIDFSQTSDTRILAKNTIEMIKAISDGEEVPVNDTETYDDDQSLQSR